ncbi:mucin-2 [Streptomyces sp. NPDC004520]|uniref:mucin-2 n=1 Tax=Streptomyces sp. NPDC004520 TaxID=3364702 RepID=UPI0036986395
MHPYATAQAPGTRIVQCDATAVRTAPHGVRAYALLDGIGDSEKVRSWTRTAAAQVARAAARRADAGAGLRSVYDRYAAERADGALYPRGYFPKAAAVVAVTAPGRPLTVAWCGDSRAYLLTSDGEADRLTQDHNLRRVQPSNDLYGGGSRHTITSCLGSWHSDEDLISHYKHPAIETATRTPAGPCRLLLASDGAYEPHEDARAPLARDIAGDLGITVRRFVKLAVRLSLNATRALDPNRLHADNATALLADLT